MEEQKSPTFKKKKLFIYVLKMNIRMDGLEHHEGD